MTQTEIILMLTAAMAISWAGIVTTAAFNSIKRAESKADYYQQPETQVKIAQHVLKNKWYTEGGEVFR